MTRLTAGLGIALVVLPTSARAADDVFLCAPGTIANVTSDAYFKTRFCTEPNSVSFGTQSLPPAGGAPGAPDVEVAPIVVTLNVDENLAAYGDLVMSGAVIPELTLNHRKYLTQTLEPYLVVTVQGARVIEAAITQSGDDVPNLRLVIDWTGLTWSLRPVNPTTGNLGAAETFTWPQP